MVQRPRIASRSAARIEGLSMIQDRPERVDARFARVAVSVVIPAYRRADTLPRAIESVLSQSLSDLELIVVDDASPDRTVDVVAGYAAADPRVGLVRQPENRGVAAARNRGVAEARCESVAFLDADDEVVPEKLARQVDALARAEAGVGLVYTGVETVGRDGARVPDHASRSGRLFPALLERNVLNGAGSSALIPRHVFDEVGGFDEALPAAEDYELWLRIARSFAVLAVPEPLIRYHDPAGDPVEDARRRSRNLRANRAARETILRRFRPDMRRLGVEHLFVLDSARRELANGARAEFARQMARLLRLRRGRAHLARAALRRASALLRRLVDRARAARRVRRRGRDAVK
jgi:glycosyltransferase involved in cell wall biosynthesis